VLVFVQYVLDSLTSQFAYHIKVKDITCAVRTTAIRVLDMVGDIKGILVLAGRVEHGLHSH
jgi:hypothetical protein